MASFHPDSGVIKRSPPASLPSYEGHPSTREVLARFADGQSLRLERGRERHYPGLIGEAPPTLPLYETAIAELGSIHRVLDAGCGSGRGTELFTQRYDEVIGVDRSPEAVRFSRQLARDAKIIASDLSFPQVLGTVDGAAVIDLLGQATRPEEILMSMRGVLPTGRQAFIAEALAMGSQYLRVPARRAFSRSSLETLLVVCGYEVVRWVEAGSFLACVATPFEGSGWEWLRHGYAELAEGKIDGALSFFARSAESDRKGVQLEAALGEAECHLTQRNGDRAIAAYFRARDLAAHDARPMAGLSRIALAMGDTSDSAQLAEAALRLDPTDLSAVCASAMLAERVSPERAKSRWLVASNLAPESFDIALHLAEAAAEDSDCALAVWALERVRAYGDDHGVNMPIAMASALLGAGRTADAMLEAHLAEALAPFDDSVKALMAQIEAAQS